MAASLSPQTSFSVLPSAQTVLAMVAPMPAAIMAYSIAVAASSSLTNRCASRTPDFKPLIDASPLWARLNSEQRRQVRHQRHVRGRHRKVPQPVRPHPFEALSFLRGHVPLPAPADVERSEEMEVRVGMAREGQRRETGLL